MTARAIWQLILPLALTLAAGAVQAGSIVDGRYRPGGGEFSIGMHQQADRVFAYGHESDTPDRVVVDFTFAPGATIHGMFLKRTIVWL